MGPGSKIQGSIKNNQTNSKIGLLCFNFVKICKKRRFSRGERLKASNLNSIVFR